jgi:cytochrome c553
MNVLHFGELREARRGLRSKVRRTLLSLAAAAAVLLLAPAAPLAAMDFSDVLKRVDHGIRKNPKQVSQAALLSCKNRRNFAVYLYDARQVERAERSLRFCLDVLEISETGPLPGAEKKVTGPSMEQLQARAAKEVELALKLEPDTKRGLEIYRDCALCHKPEGWGMTSGLVPQLAGQHRNVVIKQLADIRAGNRDTVLMIPYATVEAIGGAQAVADVAGYIDTLEISVENGKGPGTDIELGATLYRENCARCHGPNGEGSQAEYVPRIQAQHYDYLVRQFKWIRDGKRRNANAEMVKQIQDFDATQMEAVLDYVSRLQPPEELQAPPGWHNPDFVAEGLETVEANASESGTRETEAR